MSLHTIGILSAVGAAVTWGLTYTLDQKILTGISPVVLLFVSFLLGALLLLPMVFLEGGAVASFTSLSTSRLLLIISSVILVTLANYLGLVSIGHIGASLASVFEISYPFFIFLFSFLIFGSELNIYIFTGSLFIFLGSAIILRFG